MVYFPNLEREIAGRGLKKKDLAKCLGICYRSLNNKLSGRVPFTWSEVTAIKDRFFPDMTTEALFARADLNTQDSA